MLKPIHRVTCSPALSACQQLMTTLAIWLTDPGTTPAGITQQNMQPPRFPSAIEADWLWSFLQRKKDEKTLLDRAKLVSSLSINEKKDLKDWINIVSQLVVQFQPSTPLVWPVKHPNIDDKAWKSFKFLMESFYKMGLRSESGLPYLADGTPVAQDGINYKKFVENFRNKHRLNIDPNASEVCVLCGGQLLQPEVDHWVAESAFPSLSVCADNLVVICRDCNSPSNKGIRPVHSNGCFDDWFHPYHRHTNGNMHLDYILQDMTVKCKPSQPVDQPRVTNLDNLLNLTSRWTRRFKEQYVRHQGVLRKREQKRIDKRKARHTQADIREYVEEWKEDLLPSEPHHEVHLLLSDALLEPSRLAAWATELSLL